MGNKGSRDDDDEETEKKEEKPMSIKDHKKALENKKAARKLRVTDLEKKWHKAQAMTVKSPGSSPGGSKK
eukprot:1448-Heterococcus_DN1.PRE.3